MISRAWSGAVVAGLVAAAGCAHGGRSEQKQAAAQPQAPEAQRAQRASQQAVGTERQLAQARQRVEAARQDAARADQQRAQARQALSQAEQRVGQTHQRVQQEQANVQRLDALAREQREQANDAAVAAQLEAEQARGLRTAAGRIAEASPTRVVLETQPGQTMAFQIDPGTQVLVGTEQRSVADLQQGAEARVAYDPRSAAEPAAVAIHVTPARSQLAPGTPPAAPGQPSQQAQPQAQPPRP